jgi:hypothetical protein
MTTTADTVTASHLWRTGERHTNLQVTPLTHE